MIYFSKRFHLFSKWGTHILPLLFSIVKLLVKRNTHKVHTQHSGIGNVRNQLGVEVLSRRPLRMPSGGRNLCARPKCIVKWKGNRLLQSAMRYPQRDAHSLTWNWNLRESLDFRRARTTAIHMSRCEELMYSSRRETGSEPMVRTSAFPCRHIEFHSWTLSKRIIPMFH